MFRILTLILIVMVSVSAQAKAPRAVPPAQQQGRVVVSLDGSWDYALDSTGQAPRNTWAAALPADTATCKLPLSWKQAIALQHIGGAIWFARDITLPGIGDSVAVQLNLDHLVGLLEVYLDGGKLASLTGNGLPQWVLIRGFGGSFHRLALRLERGQLPPGSHRPLVYDLGHVSMELQPPTRIDALSAVADPAKHSLTVRYRLLAETTTAASLRVEVLDIAKKRTMSSKMLPINLAERGVDGEYPLTIKRMQYWSPDKPDNRYLLRATLLVSGRMVDQRELTCGTSNITYRASHLLLNGQPVQLKGLLISQSSQQKTLPDGSGLACRHQFDASTAEPSVRVDEDLKLAQQAGFNAIMTDGIVLPEDVLSAADRLGMLVVGAVPAGGDGHPAIRETVEACAHHPCIVAWDWMGSDDTGVTELRALDPARLALVRDGLQSRLILPHSTTAEAVASPDYAFTLQDGDRWQGELQQLEARQYPVLVTGLGVELSDTEGFDEALCFLRGAVESLRCSKGFSLLGYFICMPEAETMTAMSTPSGVPTNALTTSVAFNQPCTIVMRAKQQVTVGEEAISDVTILNEKALTGECRLYLVVTAVQEGNTSISPYDIILTGNARQDDLHASLSFIPSQPGEYRLQLVFTRSDKVVASTQILSIQAERGRPADE